MTTNLDIVVDNQNWGEGNCSDEIGTSSKSPEGMRPRAMLCCDGYKGVKAVQVVQPVQISIVTGFFKSSTRSMVCPKSSKSCGELCAKRGDEETFDHAFQSPRDQSYRLVRIWLWLYCR